jgi:two-component system cell cycle sensor histidine kinase/response regulator CckA
MPKDLEALLDSLPCGAALLSADLRLSYCNRRLEGWLGRPRAGLLEGDLVEVFGAETANELAPLAAQVLEGQTATRQVRLQGGTHGPHEVLLRLRPHRGQGGRVEGLLLSAEHIEKGAKPDESHAQHDIEEVQRVAKIGTYHTDLKVGTWTASEGFCRIFGFEPGGVYTQEEFQAIVHPEDLDRVMAEFGACIAERRPFDYEYRCITRHTGETIHVRSTSQIFWDEQGELSHIIGIKQDISERKELARQLVASQRMEAIGQLVGGISHDFNNMLAAIMGFTELSLMDTPADDSRHDKLQQVLASSLRARGLVQQLLAFSKRRIVEPEVLQPNETIRGVDKLLRRLLGEHIQLQTRLQPELWTVRFDPGAIEQVIVNLAINARDAMPGGGSLTIQSDNLELDTTAANGSGDEIEAGQYVVISVSDTGTGMDEATRSRIFEPFFTTKPEGKGTGLGLATCYGLVTQAKGRITVYSEPGEGSVFKIYLPRVQEQIEHRAEEAIPEVLRGTERVLLVEDDEAVRNMTAKMLTQLGYQVLVASNASAALQLLDLSKGKVDLLLTDIVIPGMTGTELAKLVQARSRNPRVLYMSGYTTDAIVNRGELERGVHLLQKPFGYTQLGRMVRQVLDG